MSRGKRLIGVVGRNLHRPGWFDRLGKRDAMREETVQDVRRREARKKEARREASRQDYRFPDTAPRNRARMVKARARRRLHAQAVRRQKARIR